MSDQTLDQIAPGGVIQLNPPSSLDDATFDSLFPAEPSQVPQAAPQPTAKPGQQPPVTSPVTPQNDFFLKGDRTVYKTVEDATKGINEKDTLIEQLRQRYALTTGIDPITGKPVVVNGTPQDAIDYSTQPDKYLDDLYNAAKKGTPEEYKNVQQKFLFDSLKPLAPLMQKVARDQAADALVTEVPGAKGFVGSANFTKAVEANPSLKSAIAVSEGDQRFYHQLPGLYKLAYQVAQGLQLPEILAANAATQIKPTQTTQTTPPRTTVQPTTASSPTT